MRDPSKEVTQTKVQSPDSDRTAPAANDARREPVAGDDAQRLHDLLEQWILSREQGRDIAVAELCRDATHLAPALAEEIALYKSFERPNPARPGQPNLPVEEFAGLRYQPLRYHAQGGLGVVFVARDTEVGREVALKRIQERRQLFPKDRERFKVEAEITGRLEHPGIVPVYSVSQDGSEQPYYTMRLIQGRTFAEAISAFHQRGDPSRHAAERTRDLRALLTRFIAVCNTIGYAHSRGVIHRDLKPGNILLGDYNETLVIDWGLARQMDDAEEEGEAGGEERTSQLSSRTQTGDVMGTLGYMSPEQARGERGLVGPASDVFSLGATLYSILTGQAPYGGAGSLEDVRNGRFVRPRQVSRAAPPALEAVCLKAMAARSEERYPRALDLAADVQRWLDDEPVSAYREPLPKRLGRWARRHRTLVAAGLMLLTAGMAGLALGLWAVGREQARTTEALQQAEKNLAQAEANLKLAGQAIDECFNIVKKDPLFQEPRMEQAKKLLLEKALPFYRHFRTQRPNDPLLQHEEADQWFRVAYIELVFARSNEARHAYEQARDLMEKLVKAHPEVPQFQDSLARTNHDLGYLLETMGNWEEALKAYQIASDLENKLLQAYPGEPQYQSILALAHTNRGNLLRSLGKIPAAWQEYDRAHDLQAQLVRAHPQVPEYQNDLARTHNNRGYLFDNLGKHEEALKEFALAADLQSQLIKAHPEVLAYQIALALTHTNRGNMLLSAGKEVEALASYQDAEKLQARLLKVNPEAPEYQHALARTHTNQGLVLGRLAKVEAAMQAFEHAQGLQIKLVKTHPDRPDYQRALALTYTNRGAVLADLGKREEALREYQQAENLLGKLVRDHGKVPEYRNDQARILTNLGVVLAALGRDNEALLALQRAHTVQSDLVRDHPELPGHVDGLVRALLHRGALLAQTGQFPASFADFDEAVRLMDKRQGAQPHTTQAPPYLLAALRGRAEVLTRLDRPRDADADWDRLVALVPTKFQPEVSRGRAISAAAQRARSGDYRRAAADASDLSRGASLSGSALYDLACVFALSASAAARDIARMPPEREKDAANYTLQAVTLLERARVEGYFRDPANRAHLDKDEDFTFLRTREEFRAFLKTLAPM